MSWKITKEKPQSNTTPPSALAQATVLFIYALLLLNTILVWMLEYSIPKLGMALIGAAIGAIAFSLAFLFHRVRYIILLAATLLFIAAAVFNWQQISLGAIYAAELIYSRFTEVFVAFATVSPPSGIAGVEAFGVFLLFGHIVLAGMLAGAVLWLHSFWMSLFIPMPFFWFAFANVGLPPTVPTILLICCWCGLLLKGYAQKRNPQASAGLSLAAMLLCGIYLICLIGFFPSDTYRESPRTIETRRYLENVAQNFESPFDFNGGPWGGSGLGARRDPEVNLASAGNLQWNDRPAMRIRGRVAENMYLRGFSCDVYDGSSWTQSNSSLYEEAGISFQPLTYGRDDIDRGLVAQLDFEYLQSLPYALAPYQLVNSIPENATSFFQDAYLTAEQGTERYTVRYGTRNTENLLQEAAPANGMEEAYLQYMMETYTQLPEGLDERLREIAAGYGISPAASVADWPHVIQQVAEQIPQTGPYTRTPGIQPAGEDFVEYFLTESQTGYCVHFASAAATMLRSLGVPSRYVEGFVAPNIQSNNTWVDLPSKNAHAWVEVWQPSIGWLPIEVTPGGADSIRATAPPSSSQNSSSSSVSSSTASSSSSSTESSSQANSPAISSVSPTTSGAGSEQRGSQATWADLPLPIRILLLGVGIVIAVSLSAVLIYKQIRRKRKQSFQASNSNYAVLAMYRYLDKLQRFGYTPSPEATALAGKAKFSQHKITPEERLVLLQEVQKARSRLLKELPWLKRVWFYICSL